MKIFTSSSLVSFPTFPSSFLFFSFSFSFSSSSLSSTSSSSCSFSSYTAVATEGFLQVWNIVLIVLGVLAFVIGDAVAAGLGMMLFVRSDNLTGIHRCQPSRFRRDSTAFGVFVPLSRFTLDLSHFMQQRTILCIYRISMHTWVVWRKYTSMEKSGSSLLLESTDSIICTSVTCTFTHTSYM